MCFILFGFKSTIMVEIYFQNLGHFIVFFFFLEIKIESKMSITGFRIILIEYFNYLGGVDLLLGYHSEP